MDVDSSASSAKKSGRSRRESKGKDAAHAGVSPATATPNKSAASAKAIVGQSSKKASKVASSENWKDSEPDGLTSVLKEKKKQANGPEAASSSSTALKENLTWKLSDMTSNPARQLPVQLIAPGSVTSEAPLFSHDGEFFFVPNGGTVKIFSRLTGQVVSTLSISSRSSSSSVQLSQPSTLASGASGASGVTGSSGTRITCLALHPMNPYRLIAGSTDGHLRIWDYTEGVLLSTLPAVPGGLVISHLAVIENADAYLTRKSEEEMDDDSPADQKFDMRQYAFVVVQKRKMKKASRRKPDAAAGQAENETGAAEGSEERENSLVYAIHLRYNSPGAPSTSNNTASALARAPIRLGKTRGTAAGLKLSADGKFLICLGNKKLQVALVELMMRFRLGLGEFAASTTGQAEAGPSSPSKSRKRRAKAQGGEKGGEEDHRASQNPLVDFVKFATSSHLTCLALPHAPNSTMLATGSEDGVIRLWHTCLDEDTLLSLSQDARALEQISSGVGAAAIQATEKYLPHSKLHWHAHGVHSLAFSENDAQLLSGGEENVLVIWQLGAAGGTSGNQTKKEFVPRLSAPIASVAETQGYEGRDREYVVALQDGSIAFINAVNLKVNRTFARVRIDATRSRLPQEQQRVLPMPIAVEPLSGSIVLPSSHPSSIQFFSNEQDQLVYELEVSPSNRTFRAEEDFIEPVRANLVAFAPVAPSVKSMLAPRAMAEWMAVLETRQAGEGVSQEMALTFWRWRKATGKSGLNAAAGGYELVTRVEKPHAQSVTDMQFSTPTSAKDAPVLATSSKDGSIRLWSLASFPTKGGKKESFWALSAVLTHRAFTPDRIAFTPDGALLAATHGPSVTIWDVGSNALRFSLTSPEVDTFHHLAFGGRGGRYLAASGKRRVVMWDVISRQVTLRHAIAGTVVNIWSDADSIVLASQDEDKDQTSLHLIHPEEAECIPIGSADLSCRTLIPTGSVDGTLSVVAISDSFDVVHVGPERSLSGESRKARSLASVSVARTSLFDDLFGRDDAEVGAAQLSTLPTRTSSADGLLGLFATPTHLLPSMETLFTPFMSHILPKAQVESTKKQQQDDPTLTKGDAEITGESVKAITPLALDEIEGIAAMVVKSLRVSDAAQGPQESTSTVKKVNGKAATPSAQLNTPKAARASLGAAPPRSAGKSPKEKRK